MNTLILVAGACIICGMICFTIHLLWYGEVNHYLAREINNVCPRVTG